MAIYLGRIGTIWTTEVRRENEHDLLVVGNAIRQAIKAYVDVDKDKRFPTRLHDLTAHPAAVGFPEHHPEMHTFLGVPIVARSQVVGILYLAERRDGADFTTDDELLITSFAAAASVNDAG